MPRGPSLNPENALTKHEKFILIESMIKTLPFSGFKTSLMGNCTTNQKLACFVQNYQHAFEN